MCGLKWKNLPLLRKKCPYSEFCRSLFSRIRTEHGPEKKNKKKKQKKKRFKIQVLNRLALKI